MVTIDDFAKVELKVGTVLQAEEIEGSDRLLRLMVDLDEGMPRQILSGIKQWYKPKDLIGKQFVFVSNLEPRDMMGLQSQGMILCTDSTKPIPLKPARRVKPGTKIR